MSFFVKKWNRILYAFVLQMSSNKTCLRWNKTHFNIIFEKNIVLLEENVINVVYDGEITADLLLVNLIICISKWVIWKIRNYIKYNKRIYREIIVTTHFKNELRSNIQMMIKNSEVWNLYDIMKLQLLLDTLWT